MSINSELDFLRERDAAANVVLAQARGLAGELEPRDARPRGFTDAARDVSHWTRIAEEETT